MLTGGTQEGVERQAAADFSTKNERMSVVIIVGEGRTRATQRDSVVYVLALVQYSSVLYCIRRVQQGKMHFRHVNL